MVPACRSLDAMSIFALTAEDAAQRGARRREVRRRRSVVADRAAARARRGLGARRVPLRRAARGAARILRQRGVRELVRRRRAAPARPRRRSHAKSTSSRCSSTARLLYEGPWVAERYLATESLLTSQPEAMLDGHAPDHLGRRQPEGARRIPRAVPAEGTDARRRSRCGRPRQCCCCPPPALTTASPTSRPIPSALNSTLGRYTNFVNLMDLAAVAVPAGFTPQGLPFGVSLIAPAWSDADLLALAAARIAPRCRRWAPRRCRCRRPNHRLATRPTAPSTSWCAARTCRACR